MTDPERDDPNRLARALGAVGTPPASGVGVMASAPAAGR